MSDTKRDCIHGSLARACFICELQADLAASEARVKELEAERNDAVDDLFRYKAASCFKGHAVPPFKCALCEVDRLKAELAALFDMHAKVVEELERERVRLAGCGVAAIGGEVSDVTPGSFGHSASLDDVVKLRADRDRIAGVMERVRELFDTGSYTFSREQLDRAIAGGEAARGERREGERRVNDPNDFSQDGFVGLHGALFAFRAATNCLHPINRSGDRRKAGA